MQQHAKMLKYQQKSQRVTFTCSPCTSSAYAVLIRCRWHCTSEKRWHSAATAEIAIAWKLCCQECRGAGSVVMLQRPEAEPMVGVWGTVKKSRFLWWCLLNRKFDIIISTPTDDIWEVLHYTAELFFPFDIHTPTRPTGVPSKIYYWLGPRWRSYFAYSFHNFTEVKNCEIWPSFSTPVALEALWFRNRATYRKYKTCIGSTLGLCSSTHPISAP